MRQSRRRPAQPRSHQTLQAALATFASRFAVCTLAALLIFSNSSASHGQNNVAGSLVTLTSTSAAPNGAWSWFEDERAIIDDSDPDNTLLLVSSVSAGASPENGDVDLLWLNVDTGVTGHFELHDRLQQDDHNSAALYRRSDGRYVASYGKHNGDQLLRWRVSTSPGDPAAWEPEQALDGSPGSSSRLTYSNLYYLPDDANGQGRLYNFTRTNNFDPNVFYSSNEGDSWTYGGKLLTEGDSGDRPYLRYFADGEKIHFIASDRHPRNFNNNIYHGYVQDGQLFNSAGQVVDSDILDGNGDPNASQTAAPSDLTTIFNAGTVVDGVPITRTWTVDVAIDEHSNPVAVFQGRLDPGAVSSGGDSLDHQFFYARYDDTTNQWTAHSLAAAGRDIYAASPNGDEDDYTGLVAIDPNDPNTVYISTEIDPRTDASMEYYEIFRGQTEDSGVSWAWEPITFNSTVDNVRPLVPEWSDSETALVWMRGNYNTFTSWSTEVVAITDFSPIDFPTLGDLTGDDLVNVDDYQIVLFNLNQNLAGMTPAEALALGDLTGDLKTDYQDLVKFREFYDLANGTGTFQALASSLSVPEPNSLALLALLTSIGLPHRQRRAILR